MKHCPDCGIDKPVGDFYRNKARYDGLSSICKKCNNSRSKAWKLANPEKKRQIARGVHERRAAAGKVQEYRRSWTKTDAGRAHKQRWSDKQAISGKRRARALSQYGLTVAEFDELNHKQGGRCAICQLPAEESRKGILHVDHCHDTGQVRGLLCHRCNLAVGALGDGKLLPAALAYLEAA